MPVRLLAVVALLPLGCSDNRERSYSGAAPAAKMAAEAPAPGGVVFRQAPAGADAKPVGGKPAEAAPVERKIVYTAHLDLIVKEFEPARTAVARLVEEHKGYVSKSDVTGDAGTPRAAHWTVRVPVDRFRSLLDALAGVGHATRNATDSQDVTEEFIDAEARLKNLKVEEEALNKLMKEAVGKVEDILKVREQLRQVRGDIERLEARLKTLSQLSALSTIHVSVKEVKDYVPPSAPMFGDRVGGTFERSLDGLLTFGQNAVLFCVALVPWLPLIVVGLLAVRWLGKWAFRRVTP